MSVWALTLAFILSVGSLHSSAGQEVTLWRGSGIAYTPGGELLERYEIVVTSRSVAPDVVENEILLSSSDGTQKKVTQRLTLHGATWTIDSNLGRGVGACYDDQVCTNYIAGELTYVTTIFREGANSYQNVTVILQSGQPIKVLRDKYSR
jgi:hypothetical protein